MAKVSDVVDVAQGDEPITTLPENAGGAGSSRDIRNAALEEAAGAAEDLEQTGEVEEVDTDSLIDELAERDEEPTIDELRKLAGDAAADLTDEELQAEYQKAVAAEEAPKLPFPVYDAEGNKVDAAKLTLDDLLSGKVQIGYNAMGKEQRKAITDLLRVAANGHLNESKIATTLAERNQVHQQLQEMKKEHEAWAGERRTIQRVLEAAANGNTAPLQQLIKAYNEELGKLPVDSPVVDQRAEQDAIAAGQAYVVSTIVPTAYKVAQEYGADPTEVTNAIIGMIQNEPAEFLTQAKIESIMNHEIRAALETAGYSPNGTTPPAQSQGGDDDLRTQFAAMQKELLELKAGSANKATQAVRDRARKSPPAGGGSVSGAGDAMPAMKSRDDMKKWLRGEI